MGGWNVAGMAGLGAACVATVVVVRSADRWRLFDWVGRKIRGDA